MKTDMLVDTKHLQSVLNIETMSFDEPWSRKDFLREMDKRNSVGSVIEIDGKVAGFVVYKKKKQSLLLLNIAVHPDFRRRGVGRCLIEGVKDRTDGCRSQIVCDVREDNLKMQLFLKSMGFNAVEVQRRHFGDFDGYTFMYEKKEK